MNNEFLKGVVDSAVENVLSSDNPMQTLHQAIVNINKSDNNTVAGNKENAQTNVDQQYGRYKFSQLANEKQSVLIRKIFMIYLLAFLRNSDRWYLYSQFYYKRHQRGHIYLQFVDFSTLASNGDKTITVLSKDQSMVSDFMLCIRHVLFNTLFLIRHFMSCCRSCIIQCLKKHLNSIIQKQSLLFV